jgi:hypothetical protein
MSGFEVYYCPRSCHEGRVYATLQEVIVHVQLQHPEHDPNWWVDGPSVPEVTPS